MKTRTWTWCMVFCIAMSLQFACDRGPSEQEQKLMGLQAQLAEIEQVSATLNEQRSELAAAQEKLGELEGISERKLEDEQKQERAELPQKIEELGAAKDETFENLQALLAEFLTVALNEFPDSEETKKGLRLYSEESITIAEDMVEKAGDYKKAIDTLQNAKNYYEAIGAEVYQPILDTIAKLDEWRYITKERFDEIKKGMTKDEVIVHSGVPYYANKQEDKERGVETWLFKKREGGAAAVYFKMKTGKVYHMKFDAVKAQVAAD